MLGGSFWIALLRNAMGAALILGIFLLLDRPRFPMKKMLGYYGVFGAAAVGAYSVWYMVDVEMFIRLSGLVTIPVLGIFCFVLSADLFYLSVYKLTLGFYMLSVTVFLGVDISRLWFHGNMWIDIALRVVIEMGIMFIVAGKIRPRFHQGRTLHCFKIFSILFKSSFITNIIPFILKNFPISSAPQYIGTVCATKHDVNFSVK